MEDLKPCPFCGGEVQVRNGSSDYFNAYTVECNACKCVCPATEWFSTKQESIEVWNTRAERTCKMMKIYGDDYSLQCSECGKVINYFSKGNYCLNCGARVVGD